MGVVDEAVRAVLEFCFVVELAVASEGVAEAFGLENKLVTGELLEPVEDLDCVVLLAYEDTACCQYSLEGVGRDWVTISPHPDGLGRA